MRFSVKAVTVAGLSLVLAVAAQAGMGREVRKKAKEMTRGTLYLRMDAPCATGKHEFGFYRRPLVEVSPDGVNTDAVGGMSSSAWHSDTTYWAVRVNDPVRVDDMDVEKGTVELELNGVGPAKGNITNILLVGIYTPEDFEAAFNRAFARVPLQDEHDDWSDEIKEAVGERRLLNGMTRRQVYYVTGAPESFTKTEEDGVTVEVWNLRQSKGVKTGFFVQKTDEATGLPISITFVGGLLVEMGGSAGDFSLDD